MKKILILLLLLISIPLVKAEETEDLAPNAKSAIMIEASTGEILFQKNKDEKLAPASMTKMMSMLLIMEEIENGNLKWNEMITTSEKASSMGGSQIFLKVGEKMTVEDLLKGVAIASGNDAVVALAERVSGSEEQFVKRMNIRAKDLGLKNTNFINATGLTADNHYSSAYDMSLIAKELIKHEKILEFTSTYEDYLRKDTKSPFWLVNTNRLVRFKEGVDLAKDLLEGLVVGGTKNNIIPNGFRSIIPPDVTIKDLKLQEGVLTINFSKELLDINEKDENKMLEAIIYTLTSIDGIDKVIIKVEGEVLNKLPNSKTNIPTVLNKSYGINKSYDLSNLNDILSYTTYYTSTYNNTKYYVPVTKYINSKDSDVVKIIIKELGSSPIYQTNLMSYLNTNTVLNDYELDNNNLKLNFNELLLNDIDKKNILEEVIYTISLSMNNIYDNLESVSFLVNNEEIYTINISDIK